MFKRLCGSVSALFLSMFVNFKLLAQDVEIPLAEKVADRSENMDVFEFGKYILIGIAGLALLGLGLYGLITTGYAALMAFNDWRKGKEEFGEMAMKVGIAIAILVIIFVLIAYGYSIIG
jgi:uncharacterized membrane protein YdbT with pleckstrin-like domain